MRLHSPAFEKKLRQRVKQTIRHSPTLKKEFKQANRSARQIKSGQFVRPAYGLIPAFMVWFAVTATGHLATGLAFINLWLLGNLCFYTVAAWTRLYHSKDLAALTLLPISQTRLFRWQWQKCFRYSLFLLSDLLISLGVLAYYFSFTPIQWLAASLVATLAWATVLALATFWLAQLPRGPVTIMTAGFILVGVTLFFGRHVFWPLLLRAVDHAAPALNLILPTGWPLSLVPVFVDENQWWPLGLLLPLTLILWSLKDSLHRLLASYQYRELIIPEALDLVPGEPALAHQPVQHGPTAIEEMIQTRRFLNPPPGPLHDWWEKQLWHSLNPREKTLREFAFPQGYRIAAPWFKIFRNFALAALLALIVGLGSPNAKFSALGLGLFLSLCQLLSQFASNGCAFRPLWLSGVNIPLYAGYGIGFHELSRVLFKCSFIQIPLLLTFTLFAGLTTAFLVGFPLLTGMNFGLKTGLLLAASRYLMVIMAFSSGTNDSSRYRNFSLIFTTVFLGVLFIGLAGTALFYPRQPFGWLLCLAATLNAWVLYRFYQWFYNSNRFDLMSLPRR